jgi:8-oxo-dGTP diphosphatase
LGEIQGVYEIVLGRKTDKRNFRKKILSLGLLKPVGQTRTGLRRRPATLYAFKTRKYVELKRFF